MTRIRGRTAKGGRGKGILREGMERLTYCATMLWEAAVFGVTARRSVRESVEECEGLGREKYEGKGGREGGRGGGMERCFFARSAGSGKESSVEWIYEGGQADATSRRQPYFPPRQTFMNISSGEQRASGDEKCAFTRHTED